MNPKRRGRARGAEPRNTTRWLREARKTRSYPRPHHIDDARIWEGIGHAMVSMKHREALRTRGVANGGGRA